SRAQADRLKLADWYTMGVLAVDTHVREAERHRFLYNPADRGAASQATSETERLLHLHRTGRTSGAPLARADVGYEPSQLKKAKAPSSCQYILSPYRCGLSFF